MQDLQHADCIVIEGSNFAECHPVGFQWVMEAKARGATVIHVDPRFTRTSALADLHVPIRAGTDIAFLGGIINHVLSTESYFRDFVVAYTNAATLVSEDFQDTEELDGVFSGFDPDQRHYSFDSWGYEGVEVAPASGQRDKAPGQQEAGGAGQGGWRAGPPTTRVAATARATAAAEPQHSGGAQGRPDPAAPAVRAPGAQAALRALHT